MNFLIGLSNAWLGHIAWTSLQALVLVAVVVAIVRFVPRLSSAMRCALWWLVALQVIVGLAWQVPVTLPARASVAIEAPVVTAPTAARAAHPAAPSAQPVVPPAQAASPRAAARATVGGGLFAHWRVMLLGLWLLGLLAQVPLLFMQCRRWRRLVREAMPDAPLQALCAEAARGLGLQRVPPVRVSHQIHSPLVTGALHPVILWPAGADLDPAVARLALAHELAHVRRGDLWLGWVPALAQRVFFFHPAVLWAVREYALEREAACDAHVMRQHAVAPADYGRMLVRLGIAPQRQLGLASASPTFCALKRRLAGLQCAGAAYGARAWIAVALIGAVPYRVVAARTTVPSAPAALAGAAPANATSTAGWPVPIPPAPPAPPAPPMPPVAPVPPLPPVPPVPPLHPVAGIDWGADNAIALFNHDSDMEMFSGPSADVAVAYRLHHHGQPMLYVRHGAKAYVIRDPATVERAVKIYAPVTQIADEQGKLADQMGRIASQQGEFASAEGRLAALQGQVAAQQAELAVAAVNRSVHQTEANLYGKQFAAATPDRSDARQRALQAKQADLARQQAALEQRIAGQRETLEKSQQALGAQQQALGRQQEQVQRQVQQQMDALVTHAVADGTAKPVSR